LRRAHHLPLPVEAPLAVVASVASFALAGAAFTGIGSNLASDLVALAYLAAVVAVARLVSIAERGRPDSNRGRVVGIARRRQAL
jgi:hypothetical protein